MRNLLILLLVLLMVLVACDSLGDTVIVVTTTPPPPVETELPRPTVDPSVINFTPNVSVLNVRQCAGTALERIGQVENGDWYRANGRTRDFGWVGFIYTDATDKEWQAWVSAEFIDNSGDLAELPIVQADCAAPTPAPTPTRETGYDADKFKPVVGSRFNIEPNANAMDRGQFIAFAVDNFLQNAGCIIRSFHDLQFTRELEAAVGDACVSVWMKYPFNGRDYEQQINRELPFTCQYGRNINGLPTDLSDIHCNATRYCESYAFDAGLVDGSLRPLPETPNTRVPRATGLAAVNEPPTAWISNQIWQNRFVERCAELGVYTISQVASVGSYEQDQLENGLFREALRLQLRLGPEKTCLGFNEYNALLPHLDTSGQYPLGEVKAALTNRDYGYFAPDNWGPLHYTRKSDGDLPDSWTIGRHAWVVIDARETAEREALDFGNLCIVIPECCFDGMPHLGALGFYDFLHRLFQVESFASQDAQAALEPLLCGEVVECEGENNAVQQFYYDGIAYAFPTGFGAQAQSSVFRGWRTYNSIWRALFSDGQGNFRDCSWLPMFPDCRYSLERAHILMILYLDFYLHPAVQSVNGFYCTTHTGDSWYEGGYSWCDPLFLDEFDVYLDYMDGKTREQLAADIPWLDISVWQVAA